MLGDLNPSRVTYEGKDRLSTFERETFGAYFLYYLRLSTSEFGSRFFLLWAGLSGNVSTPSRTPAVPHGVPKQSRHRAHGIGTLCKIVPSRHHRWIPCRTALTGPRGPRCVPSARCNHVTLESHACSRNSRPLDPLAMMQTFITYEAPSPVSRGCANRRWQIRSRGGLDVDRTGQTVL